MNHRATLVVVESSSAMLPPFDREFDIEAWFAPPKAKKAVSVTKNKKRNAVAKKRSKQS